MRMIMGVCEKELMSMVYYDWPGSKIKPLSRHQLASSSPWSCSSPKLSKTLTSGLTRCWRSYLIWIFLLRLICQPSVSSCNRHSSSQSGRGVDLDKTQTKLSVVINLVRGPVGLISLWSSWLLSRSRTRWRRSRPWRKARTWLLPRMKE